MGESSSRRFRLMTTTFTWPILSASVFLLVALLLPMYLIFQHLASYNQPQEQKFLIGLILMVPVYALESFLSLLNSEAAFNCEVIRDCYEAFALYCFERYLIACLDGEERTIEFMEQQTVITQSTPLLEGTSTYGVVEHPFPMNCFLKNWNLGPQFYHAVKIGIVQYMGVAAVVHLYVFPAAPYKRGERCVRNVAVMSDYASIDTPPDPEEVKDSERTTRMRYGRHDEAEKRLSFPQSVRDVVMGSSEIIADDMRFTVSHVVEPVERGIAKVNRTFHQISENVKRFEQKKKRTKDDSYVIPMSTWTKEFSEVHDNLYEGGSVSDSGLGSRKRHHQSRVSGLWSRMRS
uniref:Uncharacterized protein n=1 Tax=Brassica campestris TaxID=3711 RepID=M4CVP9_BRACM